MKTIYENIKTEKGQDAISFTIITSKGRANGLFSEGRIWVHLIERTGNEGCMKGLMTILINKFKTNKVTFTPIINSNIKEKVRGIVKIMHPDDPNNPYKEPFEYIETEWEV